MNKIGILQTILISKEHNLTKEEYESILLSNPEVIDRSIESMWKYAVVVIVGKLIMDILKNEK